MKQNNLFLRIIKFYVDGFRSMTVGKTLWAVILIKLFIIFVILKLFFFPNFINEHKGNESAAQFVSSKILKPSPNH
ncbi:MAG: DUF4492 domain-containing protein [Prevotellaceae bacterium]|nr:DUF4492 domain-containing protein [Prevotellaceae bacterium]